MSYLVESTGKMWNSYCPNDLHYPNKNYSKYTRKLYFNYFKIALVTSLFWILLDTFVIYAFFLDCFDTPDCRELREKSKVDGAAFHHTAKKDLFVTEYDDEFLAWKKKQRQEIELTTARPHLEALSSLAPDNKIHLLEVEDDLWMKYPGEGSTEYGHNGAPVNIPSELKEQADASFHVNQFNLVASNLLSPNRTIPDIRSQQCQKKEYPVDFLPDTSIIIVFHNEAWSTLIRTLWSVINRSPVHLIREIILVDDASERGAARAKGKTLTFLDAHCECTFGWLEPLLFQVFIDRKSVISPLIDVITDSTFEYRLVQDLLAGFDWKVAFDWMYASPREMERRKEDPTMPFRTPAMAGGLFTIDRDFFYEIGSYDEEMNIWGGENLEMSFRLWMCGSQVLISPCSRVGHVFRTISPYTYPNGTDKTVAVNQMRAVEVWLDKHKLFYYKSNPASRGYPVGDLSKRMELKERLKCKDFQWYLTNIYPESSLPVDFYSVGHVRNLKSGKCIHISVDGRNELAMWDCYLEVDRQVFSYTTEGSLMTLNRLCLTISGIFGTSVELSQCLQPLSDQQKWIYHKDSHTLENIHYRKCLSVKVDYISVTLTSASCDGAEELKWVLEEFDEKGYSEKLLHVKQGL